MIKTKNRRETQKIAGQVVKNIRGPHPRDAALVIALVGGLGSGKTTFVQDLGRALGLRENILSPTFVLFKIYKVRHSWCKRLIHVDCYRLGSSRDLLKLGFRELLQDSHAIILVEWADRVKKILPGHSLWIKFAYGSKKGTRVIKIKNNFDFL